MRVYERTCDDQESSAIIPLDPNLNPFSVGLGCTISDGATLTYKVQHTFDDIYAPGWTPETANWFDHSDLTGKTDNDDGNYAFPVTAIRLTVTEHTDGSVTLRAIQAGTASA